MSDLLHYLLVSNCDDPSRRYDLEGELKKSDEWMKLAEHMANNAEVANLGHPSTPPILPVQALESSGPETATWDTIEISFLSDERVQILKGTTRETLNYSEFGFADC